MSDRHPVMRLRAPDGSRASIDVLLVPLVTALWDAGYETIGCCQDIGESAGRVCARSGIMWAGYALLEMPVGDACDLLDAVKHTPQFRDRMHWADEGAWEIGIQVAPGMRGEDAAPMPWAQVRIPVGQVGELAEVVRELGQAA